MPRNIVDLTGQRFDRWTVIRRGANSVSGNPRWVCACECGGTGLVLGNELKRGGSRSCGCLRWGWGKCGMWVEQVPKEECS
jgi:hypothetical protein